MRLSSLNESRQEMAHVWSRSPFKIPHGLLSECTSVGVSLQGSIILAKNRDRTYYPKLKLVREKINDIEVCYMYDVETDYSEGMNEKGFGIVNTTLQGKEDEKESKTVRKHKKLSADGHKIRTALGLDSADEMIKTLDLYKRGLGGHTTIAYKDGFVSIEKLKFGKPSIVRHSKKDVVVRANHGLAYPDQGYQQGLDRESSLSRVMHATRDAQIAKSGDELLSLMRKHDAPGYLEPYRTNYKVWTSSQILMDLTNLKLMLVVDENAQFLGVENRLPRDYKPKIDIEIFTSKLEIDVKKVEI